MKISAKYLAKVYGNGTYALEDFSAEIESGAFVAVLGQSGCGKTTLLRLLSGLEKPTAGELYFDGVLYSDLPVHRRDVSAVFQEYVLYPKMTVWENVATALARYNLTREEEEARVGKVLTELGMIKFKNQLPRVLSGGQQQRVALARAVVRRPSLMLFDEPLSNVAPEQRSEYLKLIKDLKVKLPGCTFIYVTHSPAEAMTVGDKLLVMGSGKCLQYGDKTFVRSNPYRAEVLRVLGAEKELWGKAEKGVFTASSGEKIIFGTDYSGKACAVYNPYRNNEPELFVADGENVAGEKRELLFDGAFDGKTLTFADTVYAADEDFRLRFIGKYGKVVVGVQRDKLRGTSVYGDISVNGGYINPADLNLYADGERVLARYRVYSQSRSVKCVRGKAKLASGKLDTGTDVTGTVNVCIDGAYIEPVKKGGLKAVCIAEEITGSQKLVYCVLKDFPTYVTFRAQPCKKFFTSKKLKIAVSPKGVRLEKPLR